MGLAVLLMQMAPTAQEKTYVRIFQTNASGDDVHVIDPATNRVVGRLVGSERNHGVAAMPDGSKVYVSSEANETLDVYDGRTLALTKRIKTSGHPVNIAMTPDGKKVYVGITGAGALDVIDTATDAVIKTISTHGGGHNAYVTPDGKYAIASTIGGSNYTVVDTATDLRLWAKYFDLGVRPIAFSRNPDGSTKWAFVQLTNLNGFAVVDFMTNIELQRVKFPELPPDVAKTITPHYEGNVSHGIGVTPDQKTLIACSGVQDSLYFYSLPDLKLLGRTTVGNDANWLTITPDGATVYVANPSSNDTSVVDIKTMKELARIKVGQLPKRNHTGKLQTPGGATSN
jgi:YVTN family beta-propeller protein